MNIRPSLSILLVTGIIALSGCRREAKTDWILETQKADSLYTSSDIEGAEAAMLGYVRKLESTKPDDVRGIDYHFCLGVVHGRLFLIYQRNRNRKEADAHFQKSVDYLNRRRATDAGPSTNYTPETLAKYLGQADSTSPVKWKSEN